MHVKRVKRRSAEPAGRRNATQMYAQAQGIGALTATVQATGIHPTAREWKERHLAIMVRAITTVRAGTVVHAIITGPAEIHQAPKATTDRAVTRLAQRATTVPAAVHPARRVMTAPAAVHPALKAITGQAAAAAVHPAATTGVRHAAAVHTAPPHVHPAAAAADQAEDHPAAAQEGDSFYEVLICYYCSQRFPAYTGMLHCGVEPGHGIS